MAHIDEIAVAAEPTAWRDAGFRVEGGSCLVGGVRIALEGAGEGRPIRGWSVGGIESTELDGLPTTLSDASPPEPAEPHPNGVVRLDHLVAFTPDLDRTVAALERAGLDLRRLREGDTHGRVMRQAFFRLGEAILEVVAAPEGSPLLARPDAAARFWGLAFTVADLDQAVEAFGDQVGSPRDAVQPGRRIATVRESAGLGPAVALMD